MGENSKIEWCDHTFNPWIGCQKVSPGCDNCYAEAMMDHRYKKVQWRAHGERKRTSEQNWKKPMQWNAQAHTFKKENGYRARVFCASLADVFDNRVDSSWRNDLFALIRKCDKLDWLVLTKRPENIEKMLPTDWGNGYSNVWLGTTAEDQTRFDFRWKRLRKVPAVVRFISYEPALGPVRLPTYGLLPDWLISGGESGAGARTLRPQWVRNVIADCRRFGIAPFHKQWGSYHNNPLVVEKGMTVPEARAIDAEGKGGGLVDGKLVREFPDRGRARSAVTQ
jgi:protein gp37